MLYEVTFRAGDDELTERVEAPDAASAATAVRRAHEGADGAFELLLVHLVGQESAPSDAAPAGAPAGA